MSNIEEIPFIAKYTDKVTKEEVSLSSILTKNNNNLNTILLCHGMFGNKNSELNMQWYKKNLVRIKIRFRRKRGFFR